MQQPPLQTSPSVQSASLAALFGMGFAIDGERWSQTLSAVLATPANRAALFLGRFSGHQLSNASGCQRATKRTRHSRERHHGGHRAEPALAG